MMSFNVKGLVAFRDVMQAERVRCMAERRRWRVRVRRAWAALLGRP